MASADKTTDNITSDNNESDNDSIENDMIENEMKMIDDKESDKYAIVETIENGNICVTASPELWIVGHILYWPPGPGPANRRDPIRPQPDWIPHMCRILKRSIATFDEALQLEQRYSKHNDSKSFEKAQAQKQARREHPVNENITLGLIDANSMINEIDCHAQPDKPIGTNKPNDAVRSKYHKNCRESNNVNSKSGTTKKKNIFKASVKEVRPLFKKNLKSKNSNLKQIGDTGEDLKKPALPRYKNYLSSGMSSNKFSSKKTEPLQLKNFNTPLKKKTSTISATITKEQYMKQNGIFEAENHDPSSSFPLNVPSKALDLQPSVAFDNGVSDTTDKAEMSEKEQSFLNHFDGFANAGDQVQIDRTKRNEGAIKKGKVNILENILIKPTSSSTPMVTRMTLEEAIFKELNELKKDQKKSDEKRVLFEARMEAKWDICMSNMLQNRGKSQSKCQELDLVDEDDDFEDLDEKFPIKAGDDVEELNWSLKRDLTFNRRMLNRLNELTGKTPAAAIRAKFKYLIADTVLEQYSWRGTVETNKKPFKQLVALNDLIFKSVRQQFTKKYKKLEYKNYLVNNWLKHSRTRQRIVTYRYPNRNQHNHFDVDEEEDEDKEHSDEDDDDDNNDNDFD